MTTIRTFLRTTRMIGVLTYLHAKQASRSSFEIANFLILPVVIATLAVYLFRASHHPGILTGAAVGAGLMGVWSSVLHGSGRAIDTQRVQGTLEVLILSPNSSVLTILPLTLSYALTGSYAIVGTVLWDWLVFGVEPHFASVAAFALCSVACVCGFGMFGLLLAVLFFLVRNSDALCNALDTPVALVSGLLIPITVLPAWMSWAANSLPTTWVARAVHVAVGGGAIWPDLIASIGISALSVAVAACVMPAVEYRCRVAATLTLT
jgi:ABC-2 type transport system permease protein